MCSKYKTKSFLVFLVLINFGVNRVWCQDIEPEFIEPPITTTTTTSAPPTEEITSTSTTEQWTTTTPRTTSTTEQWTTTTPRTTSTTEQWTTTPRTTSTTTTPRTTSTTVQWITTPRTTNSPPVTESIIRTTAHPTPGHERNDRICTVVLSDPIIKFYQKYGRIVQVLVQCCNLCCYSKGSLIAVCEKIDMSYCHSYNYSHSHY